MKKVRPGNLTWCGGCRRNEREHSKCFQGAITSVKVFGRGIGGLSWSINACEDLFAISPQVLSFVRNIKIEAGSCFMSAPFDVADQGRHGRMV
jgi:hypothetical protein